LNVYLETGAALRDLLEADGAAAVRALLRGAEVVATSRLTIAEVGRVLARLRVTDAAVAAAVARRESEFLADSDLWFILPVDEETWTRSARPFPDEPVRTLDAIHLATIERIAGVLDPLVVVSTDDRIRRNARSLGLEVRP
jgi:predicted nucleic acid-binding protein